MESRLRESSSSECCDGDLEWTELIGDGEPVICLDLALSVPISDASIAGGGAYEAPIGVLHGELWRLIATYLVTSEVMSLRATAQLAQRPLKIVSDAILEGCRMINDFVLGRNLQSLSPSEMIENMMTLRLEVRCEMFKRYARIAGTSNGEFSRTEPLTTLTSRYFSIRLSDAVSFDGHSVVSWQQAIKTTSAAIADTAFDAYDSIALANLYAAQIYAPLLGVIANPDVHARCLFSDANKLSTPRWLDFLHAISPLRDVFTPIKAAFSEIAIRFDRQYAMPAANVMANIIFQSMASENLTPMRDICLDRIGMTSTYLEDHIVPRVTASIAESCLSDPSMSGNEKGAYLRNYAARWCKDDGHFFGILQRSIASGVAKRRYCGSTPWWTLSEAQRDVLRTRVMGMSSLDAEGCGLHGRTVCDFWELYFEVGDATLHSLSDDAMARIDLLPWALQIALWQVSADTHADPRLILMGGTAQYQRVSPSVVDAACCHAMSQGKSHLALPALLATLKWQVNQACGDYMEKERGMHPSRRSGDVTIIPSCPIFSDASWAIFEASTHYQRLPFVAALFNYGQLLKGLGHSCAYETVIAQDIVSFLCDPTSSWTLPSSEISAVLLHYLPGCAALLPEVMAQSESGYAAFAYRFDLPLMDVVYAIRSADEAKEHAHLSFL